MPSSFNWSEISPDPNAQAVLQQRQQFLDSAHRAPIPNRLSLLRGLAAGKKVLDIGVVEHFAGSQDSERWLHRNLVEVADSCVGIDVLADEVAELNAKGYDVRLHDITESTLSEQFELIVMGDIIEHLGSPERFLNNVRQMLLPGGRLVVTTPNPYMLNRVLHSMRRSFPDSADHSILLGPGNILELATRSGLVLDAWYGVSLKDLSGVRNRLASLIRRWLVGLGFADEIACDTLVYELVRTSDD